MGHTQGLWEAVTRPSDGQIFGRDKAEYIIPASATEDERNPRCVAEFALVRCLSVTHSFDPCAEAAANARRIVAAVNATADIPVEALEAGVVAKLVEALEWLEGYLRDTPHHNAPAAANARSALALAKGEAA